MKKLVIFICIIFCGFHLSAMGAGDISVQALKKAIGSETTCDDYKTVESILKKHPELAQSTISGESMLYLSILNCCEDDNKQKGKCGKNNQSKIAKALIDSGADVNEEVRYGIVLTESQKKKGTLLDMVRYYMKNHAICTSEKFQHGRECKEIEKLLIQHGAESYKKPSSNNVAVAQRTENKPQTPALQQDEPVVVDAVDVAPKAELKAEQKADPKPEQVKPTETQQRTVKNTRTAVKPEKGKTISKKSDNQTQSTSCKRQYSSQQDFFNGENLKPFYDDLNLSGVDKDCSYEEFLLWEQECNKLSSKSDRRIKSVSVKSEQQGSKIKYTCVIKECDTDYKPAPNNGSFCVKKTAEERNVTTPAIAQSSSKTVTVSGTILDAKTNEPVPFANIGITDKNCTGLSNLKTDTVPPSDFDGKFIIKNVPSDAYICVSHAEYPDDKRILPVTDEELKIYLKNGKNLETVEITADKRKDGESCVDYDNNIKSGIWKSFKGENCPEVEGSLIKVEDRVCSKCVPVKCVDGYIISDDGLKCEKCEINMVDNTFGVKSVVVDNDKCIVNECNDGFTRSDDKMQCIINDIPENQCSDKQLANLYAVSGEIKENDCVPTVCDDKHVLKETDGKKQCVECNIENFKYDNATETELKDGKCVIKNCDKDFDLKNNACIKNDATCELVTNDIVKQIDNEKCEITQCADEYETSSDKKQCVKQQKEEPDPELQKKLDDAQKAYDDAKAKEQSLENRTLTAATTAATGIGGMELLRGLAEQSADKNAAADMTAYIATMRCEYANGKSVRAGTDEIELPGGNNQNLMNYRGEYFALASDLKARKEALGLKAGIESEEILDKTNLGLYDDENTGITSGSEASLYRAQMLKSDEDQSKLDDVAAASKRRVVGGAVATGAGVVGGIVGDSLINGELGKKLKEKKAGKETQKLMEKDAKALEELKKCLKTAGVHDVDKLEFKEFRASALSLKNVKCKDLLADSNNTVNINASDLFVDSKDANEICNNWNYYNIINVNIGYMIGDNNTVNVNGCVNRLDANIKAIDKKYEEADKKDKADAKKSGFDLDLKSLGIGDNISFENILSGINPLKDSKFFGSPDISSSFNLGSLLPK